MRDRPLRELLKQLVQVQDVGQQFVQARCLNFVTNKLFWFWCVSETGSVLEFTLTAQGSIPR